MAAGGTPEDEIDRLIRELEKIDSEFRTASRTYSREHAERIKARLRADREAVQNALENVRRGGPYVRAGVGSPRIWIQEVRNAAAIVFAAEETLKLRRRGKEAALARAARDRALDRLEDLLCDHRLAGKDLIRLLEHY